MRKAFKAIVKGYLDELNSEAYSVTIDGTFRTRSEAEECAAKLKSAGFNGIVQKCGLSDKSAEEPPVIPEQPKKSVNEIACEVIIGKWGAGEDRKNRLTAAGYDYDKVQAEVRRLLA